MTTAYNGRLVRNPAGTIAYVAANGQKYWVPNMATVNCLGGTWLDVDDLTFDTIRTVPVTASCNTRHTGRQVRNPEGTIAYVAANGQKYWVPNMATVNCLGGDVIQLDGSAFDAIATLPVTASCNARYIGRQVRNPEGTIAYVAANGQKYWVPNMATVNCLGGDVIQLDAAAFNAIPSGPVNGSCATQHTGRQVRNPEGTIAYVAANGQKYWVPNMATVNCLGGDVIQLDAAAFNAIPSGPTAATCSSR